MDDSAEAAKRAAGQQTCFTITFATPTSLVSSQEELLACIAEAAEAAGATRLLVDIAQHDIAEGDVLIGPRQSLRPVSTTPALNNAAVQLRLARTSWVIVSAVCAAIGLAASNAIVSWNEHSVLEGLTFVAMLVAATQALRHRRGRIWMLARTFDFWYLAALLLAFVAVSVAAFVKTGARAYIVVPAVVPWYVAVLALFIMGDASAFSSVGRVRLSMIAAAFFISLLITANRYVIRIYGSAALDAFSEDIDFYVFTTTLNALLMKCVLPMAVFTARYAALAWWFGRPFQLIGATVFTSVHSDRSVLQPDAHGSTSASIPLKTAGNFGSGARLKGGHRSLSVASETSTEELRLAMSVAFMPTLMVTGVSTTTASSTMTETTNPLAHGSNGLQLIDLESEAGSEGTGSVADLNTIESNGFFCGGSAGGVSSGTAGVAIVPEDASTVVTSGGKVYFEGKSLDGRKHFVTGPRGKLIRVEDTSQQAPFVAGRYHTVCLAATTATAPRHVLPILHELVVEELQGRFVQHIVTIQNVGEFDDVLGACEAPFPVSARPLLPLGCVTERVLRSPAAQVFQLLTLLAGAAFLLGAPWLGGGRVHESLTTETMTIIGTPMVGLVSLLQLTQFRRGHLRRMPLDFQFWYVLCGSATAVTVAALVYVELGVSALVVGFAAPAWGSMIIYAVAVDASPAAPRVKSFLIAALFAFFVLYAASMTNFTMDHIWPTTVAAFLRRPVTIGPIRTTPSSVAVSAAQGVALYLVKFFVRLRSRDRDVVFAFSPLMDATTAFFVAPPSGRVPDTVMTEGAEGVISAGATHERRRSTITAVNSTNRFFARRTIL